MAGIPPSSRGTLTKPWTLSRGDIDPNESSTSRLHSRVDSIVHESLQYRQMVVVVGPRNEPETEIKRGR